VEKILATKLPKLLVTVSLRRPARDAPTKVRGRKGAFANATATFAALRKLRSKRFDVFHGVTMGFQQGQAFRDVRRRPQPSSPT